MGKLKNLHDHVTKIIVTIFILNSRRPTVQMRPNLYGIKDLASGITSRSTEFMIRVRRCPGDEFK